MRRSHASTIRAANAALIGQWNVDEIDHYFAAGYVAHLTGGRSIRGRRAVRLFLAALRDAFPVIAVKVEILAETNDRIVWQRTMRGRQVRPYHGFPAGGRVVVWREMFTSRLRNGLIAEEWAISDLAERLLRARRRSRRRVSR